MFPGPDLLNAGVNERREAAAAAPAVPRARPTGVSPAGSVTPAGVFSLLPRGTTIPPPPPPRAHRGLPSRAPPSPRLPLAGLLPPLPHRPPTSRCPGGARALAGVPSPAVPTPTPRPGDGDRRS